MKKPKCFCNANLGKEEVIFFDSTGNSIVR